MTPRHSAFRIFFYGQALFYAGLAACILIEPAGLTDDSGISYYGGRISTLLPFTLGLGGAVIFGVLAAYRIDRKDHDYRIAYGLILCSLLLCCLMATPFNWGYKVYLWHTSFGSMLFAFQLLLSGWISFSRYRSWPLIVLWFGQFASIIMSTYYIAVPNGYLLQSQLVFQICFGLILMRVLHTLPKRKLPVTPFRAKRRVQFRRLVRSG